MFDSFDCRQYPTRRRPCASSLVPYATRWWRPTARCGWWASTSTRGSRRRSAPRRSSGCSRTRSAPSSAASTAQIRPCTRRRACVAESRRAAAAPAHAPTHADALGRRCSDCAHRRRSRLAPLRRRPGRFEQPSDAAKLIGKTHTGRYRLTDRLTGRCALITLPLSSLYSGVTPLTARRLAQTPCGSTAPSSRTGSTASTGTGGGSARTSGARRRARA